MVPDGKDKEKAQTMLIRVYTMQSNLSYLSYQKNNIWKNGGANGGRDLVLNDPHDCPDQLPKKKCNRIGESQVK